MSRRVAIGIQQFDKLREGNYFYVDKTNFIKEWWESGDEVTLIARPRRFGKTLTMSMAEHFFSVKHKNSGDLFEGLSIWEDEKYRKLQGTYPVISLSFAGVKEQDYLSAKQRICALIAEVYNANWFLMESDILKDNEKKDFLRITDEKGDMPEVIATLAIYNLSNYLSRYYGKKVIILLDEYDTPMQEAYLHGFWNEFVAFTRSLFNSTFKSNPYLERGLMTGITRVSKESIFSDLNNLEVVTTTSDKYATAFGFTEEEVFESIKEFGYEDQKEEVKRWYDGFTFGRFRDIYNPWSILNFVDKGKIGTYWANTSSNGLVGKLIREGDTGIKNNFEDLLRGKRIICPIDEQIVYNQLDENPEAIWSLLLASGYLKVTSFDKLDEVTMDEDPMYELELTNLEVYRMFRSMVQGWFKTAKRDYNGFVTALLADDIKSMNKYMNSVALKTFSYFDSGNSPSYEAPERFYHGFVLGLIVDLASEYVITSNRESGFGRYDVMIEPKDVDNKLAFIFEFKVFDQDDEKSLSDTVAAAHAQIEEKLYEANLIAKGVSARNIRKYGFAFEGKKVLIG